jgi:hypothetical protein
MIGDILSKLSPSDIVAGVGAILALFGIKLWGKKTATTAARIRSIALGLARLWTKTPKGLRPSMETLLSTMESATGLDAKTIKAVIAQATKIVLELELHAMADAAERTLGAFEPKTAP